MNRIIANLRRDDDTPRALTQHDQLQKICDGLPCFHEQATFHKWVKNATMKHPQRRTAFQGLYIVELQEIMPTEHIQVMAERALLSLKTWGDAAPNVGNLSIDPYDKEYFFRKNHAVTNVAKDRPTVGESYWICANDFDTDLHGPQQGPCGHIYCHDCFKKILAQALRPSQTRYTCAFCRSCLVCGVSSCEDRVFAAEKTSPSLDPSLHLLCMDHCVANENEKLYGMSPMCYWEFREQSQDLRMVLHLQVYQRDLALDPVHVGRDEEEVKQSVGKLKGMAV